MPLAPQTRPPRSGAPWVTLLTLAGAVTGFSAVVMPATVAVWDTGSRFSDAAPAGDRTAWRAIPSELLAFEAEPLKAASDPGYYGREYAFAGDAVVENRHFLAVFESARGRVILYAKPAAAAASGSVGAAPGLGVKVAELGPPIDTAPRRQIARCQVLRNIGDEVAMSVTFSTSGLPDVSAVFAFDRSEIVEVRPAPGLKGLQVVSPMAYGVVPGFVGDDLILPLGDAGLPGPRLVPADNVFVGLLRGEGHMLVLTWPSGEQRLTLAPAGDPGSGATLPHVTLDTAGQSLYLAVLSSAGIWHREELTASFLEKDVPLSWKPPFTARWKTQLREGGVRTTYTLRAQPGPIWRGVAGSYDYPVWFDGETAHFHLSKKVPPKGEAILYFLEGQETPEGIATPVELVKATLGRAAAQPLLDVAGRKLRTHHRRGGDGVHRACTCGCTEAIQVFFDSGSEAAESAKVREALEDMNYFVQQHLERIGEYQRFAADLTRYLEGTAAANPALKPWCDELAATVQQIPQECAVQKDNMQSLDHAADLTRRTMALTAKSSPDNLKAYKELLDAWRAMGGAQDYVVAKCHLVARQLFQDAGYGCGNEIAALVLAREVRARCRGVLRNPDGYEIWADY